MVQLLLMGGVWGIAAVVADVGETRMLQNIGAGLANALLVGWALGLVIPRSWSELEPVWLAVVVAEAISFGATLLLGQLISRLAYVVDNRQAWVMSLTAACGYVLLDLFWRWAVSM